MEAVPSVPVAEAFKRHFAREYREESGEAHEASTVQDAFYDYVRQQRLILKEDEAKTMAASLVAEITGYGPLTRLFDDEQITEIMINGAGHVYVEKNGMLTGARVGFENEEEVQRFVERLLGPLGVRVDESSPYADGRLPDGSRINVIMPPLSLDGRIITIRRFPLKPLSVEDLIAKHAVTSAQAEFLRAAVVSKKNVVISGGTGTGKTTFLNVLASFIPQNERLITIEDAAELRLPLPHVVRLQSRPPNIENKGEVTIRDLVRNALRMRPDRIIVGEVRGGEALDMLQAMNTGHEGSMTTVHANSCVDALRRLEIMVLLAGVGLPYDAAREQIRASLDLVVHLERSSHGARRVAEILDIGQVRDHG